MKIRQLLGSSVKPVIVSTHEVWLDYGIKALWIRPTRTYAVGSSPHQDRRLKARAWCGILYRLASHLLFAGDFNARTRSLLNYLIIAQYVFDRYENYFCIDGKNRDSTCNAFGKELSNLCINTNAHILNGRHLQDKDGEYTCITPNGTSVVDYIILSSDLFDFVSRFEISDIDWSYHFLLVLVLKQYLPHNTTLSNDPISPNDVNADIKYRWSNDHADIYKMKLSNILNLEWVTDYNTKVM